MANVTLSPEVRRVLERSTITESKLVLPEQLDRATYEAVNKVITLAGGKWNRSAGAHLFSGDPRIKLGLALQTGVAVDEKKLFQFFPAPPALAARVVQRAHVSGCTVLEPSAGQGALARECSRSGGKLAMIEFNPEHQPALSRLDGVLHIGDFLSVTPTTAPAGFNARFDRIVMNPPFAKKQDLKHVAHAVKHWLKPGGRLVAIMFPHTEDEVVEYVGERCSFTTEEIEAGAFKESGTNIRTMLLILDNDYSQPHEDKPKPANPLKARLVPGRRTGIAPAALQAHLDSATNAAAKGQAQYFTPLEWAEILALPLPNYRATIVDLACGNGQLLAGAARDGTHALLGCDIEPPVPGSDVPWSANLNTHRVSGDVTQFYPLLRAADFQADLFVLNPPWDLHWHRDRLADLALSDCAAVGVAFEAHDGRTAAGTIDSTVATLCLALDRCSAFGEGLLIANNATLDRLIFAEDAPHRALAAHVWHRFAIQGNICSGKPAKADDSFWTGILYFARNHTDGCRGVRMFDFEATPMSVRRYCEHLHENRGQFRRGAWATNYLHTEQPYEVWDACAGEWRIRTNTLRNTDWPWNIWLDPDGCLQTNLTPFDEQAAPVKKREAATLHKLAGKHPMQLVLQKADRKALITAALGESPWRVAPAVVEAVQQALADYDAVRAPLYPLNKIQRLGYLDDNDDILCLRSFGGPCGSHFEAGRRYPIRTETMAYKRQGEKTNLEGGRDKVEFEGSELAFYIDGRLFMDVRLKADDVRLSIEDPDEKNGGVRNCPIEHTMQELVEHFEIPEVPDVAARNPEGYQRNLDLLAEIEQIVNA